MTDGTVVVARFPYRHEAEIAQGFLESAGLRAAVFADDGGGSEPALGFIRTARVVVRIEDKDEALQILREVGTLTQDGSAPES